MPPETAAPDLSLDYLNGVWSARREINGVVDAFVGSAVFAPDPDVPGALVWEESGELRLDGHVGPAFRRLLVDAAGVRFDDGRPFHPFRAGSLVHLCAPDTYRGIWNVHDADRFTVTWTVTGPGRRDLIVCDYRRTRGGPTAAGGSG